jgi:spore coat protein A
MKSTGTFNFTAPAVLPDKLESGPKDVVRADPGMVTTVLVHFSQFTGHFVWHCHLLAHEENMMMRPLAIVS